VGVLGIPASPVLFEPSDRFVVDPRLCFGLCYEFVNVDLFAMRKEIRTYHSGSAFIWTGLNLVLGLEPGIVSLCAEMANLASGVPGHSL
jgi:hypothetical protein